MLMVLLAATGLARAAHAPVEPLELAVPEIAGIDIRQSVRYYEVQALTAHGLLDEIRRYGPLHEDDGERGAGHTRSGFRWSYDLATQDADHCTLDTVRVGLEMTITLPRWRPAQPPPTRLAARWSAYASALAAHERHHRDLAIETAVAIRDALTALPPLPCAAAGLRVDAATARILATMARRNRDFDQRSRHARGYFLGL